MCSGRSRLGSPDGPDPSHILSRTFRPGIRRNRCSSGLPLNDLRGRRDHWLGLGLGRSFSGRRRRCLLEFPGPRSRRGHARGHRPCSRLCWSCALGNLRRFHSLLSRVPERRLDPLIHRPWLELLLLEDEIALQLLYLQYPLVLFFEVPTTELTNRGIKGNT